jgi:hypothetical protein
MKIVCITDNSEDLRDWDRDFFGPKLLYLTKGKIYDGMNIDSNTFCCKKTRTFKSFRIIDDKGKENWFPYYLFKTLDEIRNETIDKILTIN